MKQTMPIEGNTIDVYGCPRNMRRLNEYLSLMTIDDMPYGVCNTFGQVYPITMKGGILKRHTKEAQNLEDLLSYLTLDSDILDEDFMADEKRTVRERWRELADDFVEHYESIFLGQRPEWYLAGFTFNDGFLGLHYMRQNVNFGKSRLPYCTLYIEGEPELSLEFELTGTRASQKAIYRLYRKRWFESAKKKSCLDGTSHYAPVNREKADGGENLIQTWFYEETMSHRKMMFLYTRGANLMADCTMLEGF